jgi:hypothetical protein
MVVKRTISGNPKRIIAEIVALREKCCMQTVVPASGFMAGAEIRSLKEPEVLLPQAPQVVQPSDAVHDAEMSVIMVFPRYPVTVPWLFFIVPSANKIECFIFSASIKS